MIHSIENTDINYTIRHSTRAKYARIVLKLDGYEIVLPKGLPDDYAHKFAQRKKDWMKVHLNKENNKKQNIKLRNPIPENTHELIEIKRNLKKDILAVITKYHETLGRPNQLKLKFMTSRWGSLTHKKTMNINISLAFAPYEVLEYVVVHELCHLTHMNHSDKFWQLVAISAPNYKKSEAWLKNNGNLLLKQTTVIKEKNN